MPRKMMTVLELTCKVQEVCRLSGIAVTRETYDQIADSIIPPVDFSLHLASHLTCLPEFAVQRDAHRLNTDDWTDLAVSRAARNQLRHAAKETQRV